MVRETDYGPNWEQSDYERAKNAVEHLDTVEFNGPSNGHGTVEEPSLDFTLGRSIDSKKLHHVVADTHKALESEGFLVEGSRVKCDYAGAMNPQLMIDVTFDNEVYE